MADIQFPSGSQPNFNLLIPLFQNPASDPSKMGGMPQFGDSQAAIMGGVKGMMGKIGGMMGKKRGGRAKKGKKKVMGEVDQEGSLQGYDPSQSQGLLASVSQPKGSYVKGGTSDRSSSGPGLNMGVNGLEPPIITRGQMMAGCRAVGGDTTGNSSYFMGEQGAASPQSGSGYDFRAGEAGALDNYYRSVTGVQNPSPERDYMDRSIGGANLQGRAVGGPMGGQRPYQVGELRPQQPPQGGLAFGGPAEGGNPYPMGEQQSQQSPFNQQFSSPPVTPDLGSMGGLPQGMSIPGQNPQLQGRFFGGMMGGGDSFNAGECPGGSCGGELNPYNAGSMGGLAMGTGNISQLIDGNGQVWGQGGEQEMSEDQFERWRAMQGGNIQGETGFLPAPFARGGQPQGGQLSMMGDMPSPLSNPNAQAPSSGGGYSIPQPAPQRSRGPQQGGGSPFGGDSGGGLGGGLDASQCGPGGCGPQGEPPANPGNYGGISEKQGIANLKAALSGCNTGNCYARGGSAPGGRPAQMGEQSSMQSPLANPNAQTPGYEQEGGGSSGIDAQMQQAGKKGGPIGMATSMMMPAGMIALEQADEAHCPSKGSGKGVKLWGAAFGGAVPGGAPGVAGGASPGGEAGAIKGAFGAAPPGISNFNGSFGMPARAFGGFTGQGQPSTVGGVNPQSEQAGAFGRPSFGGIPAYAIGGPAGAASPMITGDNMPSPLSNPGAMAPQGGGGNPMMGGGPGGGGPGGKGGAMGLDSQSMQAAEIADDTHCDPTYGQCASPGGDGGGGMASALSGGDVGGASLGGGGLEGMGGGMLGGLLARGGRARGGNNYLMGEYNKLPKLAAGGGASQGQAAVVGDQPQMGQSAAGSNPAQAGLGQTPIQQYGTGSSVYQSMLGRLGMPGGGGGGVEGYKQTPGSFDAIAPSMANNMSPGSFDLSKVTSGRAFGGPMDEQQQYMTGENQGNLGVQQQQPQGGEPRPEIVVPKGDSPPYIVGQNGPEIHTPQEDSFVIPNPKTQAEDPTAAQNAQLGYQALQEKMQGQQQDQSQQSQSQFGQDQAQQGGAQTKQVGFGNQEADYEALNSAINKAPVKLWMNLRKSVPQAAPLIAREGIELRKRIAGGYDLSKAKPEELQAYAQKQLGLTNALQPLSSLRGPDREAAYAQILPQIKQIDPGAPNKFNPAYLSANLAMGTPLAAFNNLKSFGARQQQQRAEMQQGLGAPTGDQMAQRATGNPNAQGVGMSLGQQQAQGSGFIHPTYAAQQKYYGMPYDDAAVENRRDKALRLAKEVDKEWPGVSYGNNFFGSNYNQKYPSSTSIYADIIAHNYPDRFLEEYHRGHFDKDSSKWNRSVAEQLKRTGLPSNDGYNRDIPDPDVHPKEFAAYAKLHPEQLEYMKKAYANNLRGAYPAKSAYEFEAEGYDPATAEQMSFMSRYDGSSLKDYGLEVVEKPGGGFTTRPIGGIGGANERGIVPNSMNGYQYDQQGNPTGQGYYNPGPMDDDPLDSRGLTGKIDPNNEHMEAYLMNSGGQGYADNPNMKLTGGHRPLTSFGGEPNPLPTGRHNSMEEFKDWAKKSGFTDRQIADAAGANQRNKLAESFKQGGMDPDMSFVLASQMGTRIAQEARKNGSLDYNIPTSVRDINKGFEYSPVNQLRAELINNLTTNYGLNTTQAYHVVNQVQHQGVPLDQAIQSAPKISSETSAPEKRTLSGIQYKPLEEPFYGAYAKQPISPEHREAIVEMLKRASKEGNMEAVNKYGQMLQQADADKQHMDFLMKYHSPDNTPAPYGSNGKNLAGAAGMETKEKQEGQGLLSSTLKKGGSQQGTDPKLDKTGNYQYDPKSQSYREIPKFDAKGNPEPTGLEKERDKANAKPLTAAQQKEKDRAEANDRGYDPLTPTNRSSYQKELTQAINMRSNIDSVMRDYNPNWSTTLGKSGQLEQWVASKAARLGLDSRVSKDLEKYSRWKSGIEQNFSKYRKLITGAQAAFQELQYLRDNMLNSAMDPRTFQGNLELYKQGLDLIIKSYQQSLEKGVPINGDALEDQILALNPDPKIQELVKRGYKRRNGKWIGPNG